MKKISSILIKAVAGPFYRQHTGFFLFLFFIFFGTQPSLADALRTQYAIIEGILNSPAFFFIAVSCWSLYVCKSLLFFRSCLKKNSYDFLYQLNSIGMERRLFIISRLIAVLLFPVILYGLLIVSIGIFEKKFLPSIAVSLIIILLFATTVALTYKQIKTGLQHQVLRKSPVDITWRPGLFSFLLRYIFYKQVISLVILKTCTFFALYYLARIDSNVFEYRMLWLIYLTVICSHSSIVYRNFHFFEKELSHLRNSPVKRSSMLLSMAALYVTLLIPELWALKGVILQQHNSLEYTWMLLTGPSVLLLLHCLLYSQDVSMEEFLQLVFGVWVVFVFASLSAWHWMMPLIGFGISILLFYITYYSYEQRSTVDGLE